MNDQDRKKQEGQSLVIIAVALIVVLIFAAISIDLANAYVHRRTDQNAADAAALAGARELTKQLQTHGTLIGIKGNETSIKTEMNDFAERNGIEDTDGTPANAVNTNVVGYYLGEDGERISETPIGSTGVVLYNARGVEAIAHSVAPSFFAGVMGIDSISMDAEAAVVIEGGVCQADCVAPIATLTETFQFNECYNFWDGAGTGNFGWLNWTNNLAGKSCQSLPVSPHPDDCSAPCIGYNLHNDFCLSGLVNEGEWVAGTTGVDNKKEIRWALDCFGNLPNEENKYDEFCDHIGTEKPMIVIVYDVTTGQGCFSGESDNGELYHVVGFAMFQLKGYMLSQGSGAANGWTGDGTDGNPVCIDNHEGGNRMTGVFIKWVQPDGGGDCHDFGISAPTMVK